MRKKSLLMLGDSLVEWGDWDTLLPDLAVISRGRAGELTEALSARLFDEIDSVPEPDCILLMSGTNNLLMGSPHFTAIFQTLLPRLVLLCGKSTVFLNSILPMTAPFTEQCLPITRPCFLSDGVHLSTLGYQVWAGEIRKCCLAL